MYMMYMRISEILFRRKKILRSSENHPRNVPLPTPKIHYGTIFQQAIAKTWQECFNATLYILYTASTLVHGTMDSDFRFPLLSFLSLPQLEKRKAMPIWPTSKFPPPRPFDDVPSITWHPSMACGTLDSQDGWCRN